MKVSQLAQLLDSLGHGLEGIVNSAVSSDLKCFQSVMQPFNEVSVSDFTSFLSQFGSEFQKTGKITPKGKIALDKPQKTPKPTSTPKLDDTQQVTVSVAAINSLLAEISNGTVDDNKVEQTLKGIEKLKVGLLHQVLGGLGIEDKPKVKAKILDKIRMVIRHRLESREKSMSAGGYRPEPADVVP